MGITIVGLGPGDEGLLTREAWALLQNEQPLLLRTHRHPTVAALTRSWQSFDHLYESGADFDAVYRAIVDAVVARGATEEIVYAVPGHPFMAEATVPAILDAAQAQGIPTRVVDGLSYLEPILSALRLDGSEGLQLLDALQVAAHLVPPLNTDAPALLAQVYSRLLAGELKLTLLALYPPEHAVILVHAAGSAEEALEPLRLYEIDRSVRIGHLTSLYLPPRPRLSALTGLADTVAVLRSPEGCPWDREQTPLTLRSGLIEEVAELLEALENDDSDHVLEELGDVLLHVVMQAQMAAEGGDFTIADVIAHIDAKLKYRHPHVWGATKVADAGEVVANWEALKAAEQKANGAPAASLLDNIPPSLAALAAAQKRQQRVAKVGFDWPALDGVYAKISEELDELRRERTSARRHAEVGDLLFAVVNLARWLDVDAELALRDANGRFARRFRLVETLAKRSGRRLDEMDAAALDQLWETAKAQLREDAP